MKIVLQRVVEASVTASGVCAGRIGPGLLIFLGIAKDDFPTDADYLVERVANLRIFRDEMGKMNRSALESGAGILIVPQFTLYGDAKKGRRPSFERAAPPEQARDLYEYFTGLVRKTGLTVETGVFQSMMHVSLVNDGPVTFILDSKKL